MVYPETVIIEELRWEYSLPKWAAIQIIEYYKQQHRYKKLCHLIEKRKSIPVQEVLHNGAVF